MPAANTTAAVDGYEVRLEGQPTPGGTGEVTLAVRRGDEAVPDLEPYLGALGHLVAIRPFDLAYLHVHPLERTAGPGEVPFAVEVPSADVYRLCFDFSHQETVRTAAFTVDVDPRPDHRARTVLATTGINDRGERGRVPRVAYGQALQPMAVAWASGSTRCSR